jgi:HemY protein
MRIGAAIVLVLLLGAFAAHFVLADRGYVLVNFGAYVIEMSVPGLVIVLIGGYIFVRALVGVAEAPRRWRAARAQRRFARSGADLAGGVRELIAGNWARSERLLTQGLKQADAPLVNYLLAARAAQLQGATERRNEYLKLARGISAEGATSALLLRAELELEAGEPAAAIATLAELERESGEQAAAVALLARAYRSLDDGAALFSLLPRLVRAPLPADERAELAGLALASELRRADLTSERLAEVWSGLAPELRAAPAVIVERARALARLGRGDEAERELKAALKRDWQQMLVRCYGEVRGADVAKQLRQAESWLKTYPEDTVLLTAAARLSMANGQLEKARSYLESSLALVPDADAYALYGRLLTELGETDRAALAFRSGLALASPLAAEPLPPERALAAPMAQDTRIEAKG